MSKSQSSAEDLQRVTRALRTLTGSHRALLRARDRHELLREICRVVVEEGGYRAATVVGVADDARRTLTPLAQVGHDAAFSDLQHASWHVADEADPSATSLAITTGQPCLILDSQHDPRLSARWHDYHRRHGFGSVLSIPLTVDGRATGALTIVAAEPDAFAEDEREPLLEAAADLSFGLETLAARERHAASEARVRQLMLFDPVSGLPNRAHLRQMLETALAEAKAARRPVTLVRLAIDRFHEVEEILGGDVADQLVAHASRRLEASLSAQERLAHVADAEFAVVAPGAGAEAGRQIARRLVEALAEPLEVQGIQLDARLVSGAAVFPGHGDNADVLVRRAGLALAQARRRAAPVTLFTPDLDTSCGGNLALMAELRKAIPNGELRLYCQPKVDIGLRSPRGVEALVRWAHPQRGLLPPQAFIQVAESTGLITSLTYWVLEDALRQSYVWRESGIEQPVSVNLSAHDLRDARFLERVSDKLATWGAPAGMVEFELTESTLMQEPDKALEVLNGLKRLDVKLSIDDFGTGYSSLSYLRRLPVDTLKIDQSFVRGLVGDAGAAAIVRSTIDLAHNLHLDVVAEGVEDDATFDALGELGCDAAQGFRIGRPMPAGELEGWLGRPLH